MGMLTNINSPSLKSSMSHFGIQGKVPEPRMFSKPTIMVQQKMFEVVANSNCGQSRREKVCSTSREQSRESTGDVPLGVELVDRSCAC